MHAPLHTVVVGKPYIDGESGWPEMVDYQYTAEGHSLRIFCGGPSDKYVEAVRAGRCEVAILVAQPVIVMLYHFPSVIGWKDAPFSWHLVPPHRHGPLRGETDGPLSRVLHIVLIDAHDGIVRALRRVPLTPEFAHALETAIRDQAAHTWSAPEYHAALLDLSRRFPDAEAMQAAAIAHCAA
jgi:hypothetical protein